ncbi:MAG: excinuclease ABC subunit UvrB [Armatimonadia bacterium]|nr:excinuclease ABC subunit UvrB [Armatimonadia bacterium]
MSRDRVKQSGASAYVGGHGRFELKHDHRPRGHQPEAIDTLAEGVRSGKDRQVLLGVTGSGKTYTAACVIERLQRPTLVLAHNKTLAAQLCAEFRSYFPDNAVEYFVSYYDYYQPEAYIPQTDTYIEKDTSINDEIERLRHAATHALISRRDVIVVASVSCIYGIGAPIEYSGMSLRLAVGDFADRDEVLRQLVTMQYMRSEILGRRRFRARGDVIEIYPSDAEVIVRVELFGDEVERLSVIDPLTGEVLATPPSIDVVPASHYVIPEERLGVACESIEAELAERLAEFRQHDRLLEAQRIEQRTRYDLEMLREVGMCKGIENYSRHMDGREAGEPSATLLDFFPADWLMVIDESHQTIPQVKAMWHGDRSRKLNLVEHGFRLPSALDNRPLTFEEFEAKLPPTIFVTATPAAYELDASGGEVVEMIVRPTGLLDPAIEVRPTRNQIDDLLGEIRARTEAGERSLVLTLTKRTAEDLTEYLEDLDMRVRYIHSEVKTLQRAEIIRDLRRGAFDVLVGINPLREGIDLPEVSLVAILDTDAEGYLRSTTSLIQIVGRAARNVGGKVIMYANRMTDAMKEALEETDRRRDIQTSYNEEHGITPQTVTKAIQDTVRAQEELDDEADGILAEVLGDSADRDLETLVDGLEKEMREAAAALEFERAARLRDEISELRRMLQEKPS